MNIDFVETLSIQDNLFVDIESELDTFRLESEGAAISLFDVASDFTISNNTFVRCKAARGGAISASIVGVLEGILEANSFVDCEALFSPQIAGLIASIQILNNHALV